MVKPFTLPRDIARRLDDVKMRPAISPPPDARRDAAGLLRVRSEFTEMPGLRLTLLQAMRLFDLGREACERVLRTLVEEGTLRLYPDGRYGRRDVRS
jgi:hypothetical protein